MKNVMLIHGFNGVPKIYTYFKQKLEEEGYNIIIPEFPTKTNITIDGFFKVFDKYKAYFNNELIVIAHSIGNAMFIKYISKNNLNVGLYISLAGFAKAFITEGRDDLNTAIAPITISMEEKEKFISLVKARYSIYSDNDHIVPFEILQEFTKIIDSKDMLIEGNPYQATTRRIQTWQYQDKYHSWYSVVIFVSVPSMGNNLRVKVPYGAW